MMQHALTFHTYLDYDHVQLPYDLSTLGRLQIEFLRQMVLYYYHQLAL